MKFWLTFITQNRKQDIEEMTKDIYPTFDGIVAVDHFSNDGTFELLQERKGAGKIIQKTFVKHHAHSMNEFLFAGIINNGDYFLILDSSDRINPNWLISLRKDVEYYNQNQIGGIFFDRIFLAKYIDSMEFFGAIHWGLTPLFGKVLNYSTMSGFKKESYIINTRSDESNSVLLNPSKYWWEYGRGSSHTQLLYQQFSNEIWRKHENTRMHFRLNCQFILGLDFTLASLISYMQQHTNDYPDWFERVMEDEVSVKDIFRYKVLNQPISDICSNRFNWSYFLYKTTGIINQNKCGDYVGVFNQYKLQKGENLE